MTEDAKKAKELLKSHQPCADYDAYLRIQKLLSEHLKAEIDKAILDNMYKMKESSNE